MRNQSEYRDMVCFLAAIILSGMREQSLNADTVEEAVDLALMIDPIVFRKLSDK